MTLSTLDKHFVLFGKSKGNLPLTCKNFLVRGCNPLFYLNSSRQTLVVRDWRVRDNLISSHTKLFILPCVVFYVALDFFQLLQISFSSGYLHIYWGKAGASISDTVNERNACVSANYLG